MSVQFPEECTEFCLKGPEKFWNLMIRISGLEYPATLSEALENTGLWAYFWCDFTTVFMFVMPHDC